MDVSIRLMKKSDAPHVLDMMSVFYRSPAVHTNGSEEIFASDIENCLNENPYLEGYIIEVDGKTVGYGMIAKSFSTEFGKSCIWIEDLYLTEEYRGRGVGKIFFDFITAKYEGAIFRLEVEAENERAMKLYKKCGFTTLPYMEMIK